MIKVNIIQNLLTIQFKVRWLEQKKTKKVEYKIKKISNKKQDNLTWLEVDQTIQPATKKENSPKQLKFSSTAWTTIKTNKRNNTLTTL